MPQLVTNDTKKLIQNILLGFLFLFIVLYAFFNSRGIIFGVKLKNVSLIDGTQATENVTKVTGNAKNAIKLYLNGREISLNQQGDFDETIILLPGYNIVSIRAEDKFKHVDEKNYQLTYTAI